MAQALNLPPRQVRGFISKACRRASPALCGRVERGAARFRSTPGGARPTFAYRCDGITRILEGGRVFERTGCGFNHVNDPQLRPRPQHRTGPVPFEAMGVKSLVFRTQPCIAHRA